MAPSIAVITMLRNEPFFARKWVSYYSEVFGLDNLFILDHASVVDYGETFNGTNVIRIPDRGNKRFDYDRADFINFFQQALLKYYDVVIYTDSDEFVVVDPAVAPDLRDYLTTVTPFSILAPIGVQLTQKIDEEPPYENGSPILSQRSFGYLIPMYCKPVITTRRAEWHAGFHGSKAPFEVDRNLFLLHLKMFDLEYALTRQAELNRQFERDAGPRPWSRSLEELRERFERFCERPLTEVEFGKWSLNERRVALGIEPRFKEYYVVRRSFFADPGILDKMIRLPPRFASLI